MDDPAMRTGARTPARPASGEMVPRRETQTGVPNGDRCRVVRVSNTYRY